MRSWYTQQGLAHALNIFRFPEDFGNRSQLRTLSLRFLFEHRNKAPNICPQIPELCNKAEQMFEEFLHDRNMTALYEVVDIVGEFAPNKRQRLLNRVRNMENTQNRIHIGIVDKPIKRTVYSDTQNVHNTKVNQSVLQAVRTIYGMFRHILELEPLPHLSKEANDARVGRHKDDCLRALRDDFISRYSNKNDLIRDSFKYIKTSVGTFGINISLQDTLLAIWLWMRDHEHKAELETRMLEELKEMHGYCSTGHLARLINIIQGFTDDENLCVRISDKEQYNAVIRSYLNKVLADCDDDEILDGMTKGSDKFKYYIRDQIKNTLVPWMDEYGKEILAHIPNVVNDYTKLEIFTP